MAKINLYGSRVFQITGASSTQFYAIGTQCSTNGVEAYVQRPVRSAGSFSNLSINVFVNSSGTNSFFTLRVDGADSNNAITIPSTQTGVYEDTDSVAVTAGQMVNFRALTNNGAGGLNMTVGYTNICFEATTNTVTFLQSNGIGNITALSTSYYIPIAGFGGLGRATEAEAQYKCKMAGTLKSLFIQVATARSTATVITVRKNGADTAMTISCTANTTGLFEEGTPHTVSVAVNDLINFVVTSGTGTGTFLAHVAGVEFETTDTSWPIINMAGGTPDAFGTNVTQNWWLGGGIVYTTTESQTQSPARVDFTWSKLAVYLLVNGITANSTFKSRIGGANGNQIVTFASGETGYKEDASGSDTVTAAQLIDVQMITGGSGAATFTTNQISSMGQITAGGPANTNITPFTMIRGT